MLFCNNKLLFSGIHITAEAINIRILKRRKVSIPTAILNSIAFVVMGLEL
jgi:hypothetical protein